MTILINPLPRDNKCYCCNKLKPLIKTFREQSEVTGVSWECKDCITLSKEEWLKNKEEKLK